MTSTLASPPGDLANHLSFVAARLLDGNVVPVLGAGANLCDRPADATWRFGSGLPNGAELAEWLAEKLVCDVADVRDLLRVSQYAHVTWGLGPLYQQLRVLFARDDYPIPSLHRFLASVPVRTARTLMSSARRRAADRSGRRLSGTPAAR